MIWIEIQCCCRGRQYLNQHLWTTVKFHLIQESLKWNFNNVTHCSTLLLPVNELILKQKQMSEEKRLKLDHPVSTSQASCSLPPPPPVNLSKVKSLSSLQNGSRWKVFQDALNPDQENLDLANVNLMLELLVQKKKQLEAVRKAWGSFCVFKPPFLLNLHLWSVLIWNRIINFYCNHDKS